MTHLGFEVKVDVTLDDGACWVQLSRGTAADLDLAPGQRVWIVPPQRTSAHHEIEAGSEPKTESPSTPESSSSETTVESGRRGEVS